MKLIAFGRIGLVSQSLFTGVVDAALLSPPETIEARKLGMRMLMDLATSRIACPFTSVVTTRAVLEKSPVALERARIHCAGLSSVRFAQFDLKRDKLPETFDLIVVTAVLEYIRYPRELRKVRSKLVDAVRPGGRLLVESTRANPIVENSWWGRKLIRGKWINTLVAGHPGLRVVSEISTDWYVLTLLERVL